MASKPWFQQPIQSSEFQLIEANFVNLGLASPSGFQKIDINRGKFLFLTVNWNDKDAWLFASHQG